METTERGIAVELLRPDLSMKGAYLDFARDWEEHREAIVPAAARLNGRTYEAWLAYTWQLETQPTDKYVTAHMYFAFDGDGRLVGAITLRHMLNEFLLRVGGHIGYGVRPSDRRLGYASAMLATVLPIARALGLRRVLISCDKQNTASARTILRNGGVLENEVPEEGCIVQRYWIDLLANTRKGDRI